MTGHARVSRAAAPFIARDMQIGVTDPTKKNLNLDIARRRITTLEREWLQRLVGRMRGITFCCKHDCVPSTLNAQLSTLNFLIIGTKASPSRGTRVLIADDQRDVGRSLADLVRCCNHDIVAVVGSGLEAIQAYTRYHPDLVLMDYRMPKFNGATACRNILSKDPLARIILVTGWSPSDEAGASGAIAILPKPVDFERLNAALQSVAQMLPVPSPAEMPIPEACYQADPHPFPNFELATSSSELPTPISDLPSPGFDFLTPSPPA